MTKVTLSPFDLSDATKTGRRTFRKQILRKGEIDYQGTKISFDDEFINDCVAAYKAGAYDQVPFVLATPENRHNMDPRNFTGEIVDMVATEDGIDAFVETTKTGAQIISQNPRLGVSARIVQGLAKVDGRTFPRAIQHVLATMDPRLTGMRPWQAVDLAVYDGDEEVLDLSAATVKRGTTMPKIVKRAAPSKVVTLDLSQLDDETFELLLANTAVLDRPVEEDDAEEVTETVVRKTKRPQRRQAQPVAVEEDDELEVDDEDLEDEDLEDDEEVVDEADLEDDEELEDGEEVVEKPVTARRKGKVVKQRVQLSEPIVKKRSKARRMELELAEERWASKKSDLIRSGVPPFLVDLAEPLLKSPDRMVIDLSEDGGKKVDARQVVAGLLDGVRGMVDLRPELGHTVDLSSIEENSPTAQALAAWNKEYGKA